MRVRPSVPVVLSLLTLLALPGVAGADNGRNGWLLQAEELPWDQAHPTTTARMTGSVGPGDEMDYFTFTVGSYQEIKLIPDEDPGCPEFSLSNDAGGRLDVNDHEPTRAVVRVRYQYIQCQDKLPASGRFDYGFTVQTNDRVASDPIPEAVREHEPNDSLQTAEVAENGKWYRGRTEGVADDDYFTFWTPPGVHVYYWQVLGASEEDDGWQAPAMYSIFDSPSLLELLLPNYTPSANACQNCRFSSYRVSYGPEQMRIHMPGMSDPTSWSFSVTGKPGTMLTAPYDGPVPPEVPRADPYVPEVKTYVNQYAAPLTGAVIPRLDEISDVYGFGQRLRGEPLPSGPVPDGPSGTTDAPAPQTQQPPPAAVAEPIPEPKPSVTNPPSRRPQASCSITSGTVRRGRPLMLRCVHIGAARTIRVEWTRRGKTVRRSGKLGTIMRLSTRSLARGQHLVRVLDGPRLLAKGTVSVR